MILGVYMRGNEILNQDSGNEIEMRDQICEKLRIQFFFKIC